MSGKELAAAAPFLLERAPRPAAREVFSTGKQGLLSFVPKAASVHHSHVMGLFPTLRQGYLCQEKLNGAFVCWDGARLWSKTGRAIDAPESFVQRLTPGFPVVGELYLGKGARERGFAATLASNRLPSYESLGPEAAGSDRSAVWAHARLVAFDVPGLVDTWPYRARYQLLGSVVAAWSADQRGALGDGTTEWHVHLPLQLIVQYGMEHLAVLFQDVVHGEPEEVRRHRSAPFGIPRVTDAEGGRARHWDGRSWLPQGRYSTRDGGATTVPGEGCMLWHQDRPWSRRSDARLTEALLKFKPVVLATATVGAMGVEHSLHRRALLWRGAAPAPPAALDEDEDLGGFHVELMTAVAGVQQRVKAYLPASSTLAGLRERYPSGRRVFFIFFMMEQLPMYPRALGPVLADRDALRVQRALAGDGVLPPALDDLRLAASGWWAERSTTVVAFFPTDLPWNPSLYVGRAQRGHSQRILASALVRGGVPGSDRQRRAEALEEQRERKRRREELGLAFARHFQAAPSPRRAGLAVLARLLVCVCLHAAAVGGPPPAPGPRTAARPLPARWGPLVLMEEEATEATTGLRMAPSSIAWVRDMLRVALAVIGGAWVRHAAFLEDLPQHMRGRSAADVRELLEAFEASVAAYAEGEAAPRWNCPRVEAALLPSTPQALRDSVGLLRPQTEVQRGGIPRVRITVETFVRYLHEAGCQGAGAGPSERTAAFLLGASAASPPTGPVGAIGCYRWLQADAVVGHVLTRLVSSAPRGGLHGGNAEVDTSVEMDVALYLPTAESCKPGATKVPSVSVAAVAAPPPILDTMKLAARLVMEDLS